jgi:peptidyl-prolyl cis-trans isomerase A (cyclophilin A)
MSDHKDLADGIYASFNTTKGEILIRLEHEKTPLTVCNFVGLAEGKIENEAKAGGEPYYDGLVFHRVIEDFMVQGGDPEGSGRGGPGYRFADEFHPDLTHDVPGVLSMANAGPGTNGSQFFITHGPTDWLDGKHSVFGKTIEGQDVVDAIEQGDKIETLKIIRQGQAAEAYDANTEIFESLQKDNVNRDAKLKEEAQASVLKTIEEKYADAQTTDSGMRYIVHEEGEGGKPTKGTKVKAHYTGTLLDGTKFDSSVDRGQPFEFSVGAGQVIQGWDEAFLDMKKGEKRTIVLPPELGYGSTGAGGVIPPDAFLVFEVELLDF